MRIPLFLLLLASAVSASAATITGRVSDSTGKILPGMSVAAYSASGVVAAAVLTDASGRYALSGLAAGTYRLLAYDSAGVFATSFYADAESFDVSTAIPLQTAETLFDADFVLRVAGFVTGTVRNSSGASLSGMTVAAYNVPSGTRRGFTTADGNGRYRLVLPPGEYRIAAWDDSLRYATAFFERVTTFAKAANVAVRAVETTSAVDVVLRDAAVLSGTIRDTGGLPLQGTRVTVYDIEGHRIGSSLSASDGSYRLALTGGSYRMVFDDPAGVYAPLFFARAESFEVTPFLVVADGERRSGLDASLSRAGYVSGRIVEASTRSPLGSVVVALYNVPSGTRRAFATTGSNGDYALAVTPGTYKLGAYDPARVYAARFYLDDPTFVSATPLTIAAGQTLTRFDIALPKAGRVQGRVTDASSGGALQSITVAAYDSHGVLVGTATTSANGDYELIVAPGTYKMTAYDNALIFANGYLDDAVNFDLTRSTTMGAGQVLSGQDFRLVRGARVTGSVSVAATGEALAGIVVTAYDSRGIAIQSATSGRDGSFNFALPPSNYRFVAADPIRRYETLFHPSSTTFSGSVEYVLRAGDVLNPLAFRVVPQANLSRRRSVRH